ncbi:MAG: ATP-binding cassette domain-containing protein [Acidobacteriota bacterium]|nr:ATP-binding cassette domain-containing protein [Acidobacteriota bacterium]MDH3523258.1 ATP-binding cassette domain-containing protein [Acidobacteriota bacterium]
MAAAGGRDRERPATRGLAASSEDVLSVDAVEEQAAALARRGPGRERIAELAGGAPLLRIDGLVAGYGKMEILHRIDLQVAAGQSLCLIGPNGAGKSTVLNSIYGFARIKAGAIVLDGRDVTRLSPSQKLSRAGIAYVLQDNSVFPDMTVEENLWMGGYLLNSAEQAREAAERVLRKYGRLARRRRQLARVLSGGERRLLEISRALVMDPRVLLIDEPSIGLEPRYIDMVFEILADLQGSEGKAILMVEQNAKKGLEFADVGYVLVSGTVAMADTGDRLLRHPEVGRLFLGG